MCCTYVIMHQLNVNYIRNFLSFKLHNANSNNELRVFGMDLYKKKCCHNNLCALFTFLPLLLYYIQNKKSLLYSPWGLRLVSTYVSERAIVRQFARHTSWGCLHLCDDVFHYFNTFLYIVDRHIYWKTRVLEDGASVKFIFQHLSIASR